nr:SH3 domain-containing protein [uncultured Treponema sp.]
MKKIISFLFVLFCSFSMFAKEYRGMYVNAKEGLNIREEPSLRAKKIGAIKYGEFVKVSSEGKLEEIDGITARWIKVVINFNGNEENDFEICGWVFGGYLQAECPMSEGEILNYLRKLNKTDEDYFKTEYFPETDFTTYMRGNEWERPNFIEALPNYACAYWKYETNNEVVAVRDCLIYYVPVAADAYGVLRFIKKGTRLKVLRVEDWGIIGATVFPIYEVDIYGDGFGGGYIRGIDFTGSNCVSQASDGKGGFHTLVYQQSAGNVTRYDIHENYEALDSSVTHEQLERYFSDELFYEKKYLKGGFFPYTIHYIDPAGKYHGFSFPEKSSRLKILYPLNMKNPVPIIEKSSFHGGMGGGEFTTELYAIDPYAEMYAICSYSYTSVDAGLDGSAYHFFDENGLFVYQYQTNDRGSVEENCTYYYAQDDYDFFKFHMDNTSHGEPKGKSNAGRFEKGKYYNPICSLTLRSSPGMSADKINTVKGGTLLEILEVGKKDSIDGYTSNWVKVRAVNKERFAEGYKFTGEGWVFGAYLK